MKKTQICRIEIDNFKKIKRADIELLDGFERTEVSEVADAVNFALGEGSLRKLRARRISDLICPPARLAKVVLYIDGEKPCWVKRTIGTAGKTLYTLDGIRTTRERVMEKLGDFHVKSNIFD